MRGFSDRSPEMFTVLKSATARYDRCSIMNIKNALQEK